MPHPPWHFPQAQKLELNASFYVATENVPNLYIYLIVITHYVGVNAKYSIRGKSLQESMLFLNVP